MRMKSLAFILTAVLCAPLCSLTAFAEDDTLSYENLDYTVEEDGHITITNCFQNEIDCVIPSEIDGKPVTEIADSAFAECYYLESVIIPDSVKTIGRQAFSACSALKTVDMPLELEAIGAGVFDACSALTEITIPAGVKELPEAMFYECSSLKTVTLSEGIEVIDTEFFYGCTSLTTVSLPQSLTSIGEYAFEDCTSLKEITFPENLVNLGGYVFQDCPSLENIYVKEGNPMFCDLDGVLLTSDGVTLVRYPEAKTATSYTVPDGCTQLANGSFLDAVNLTSIDLNGAITYGMDVFFRCTGLKEITFPEGVTDIAPYMLAYCSSIETVNLPSTLKNVGAYSFYTCAALETLSLPDGTETIDDYAFFNCIGLKELTLPDTIISLGDGAIGYFAEAEDKEPDKVPGFKVKYGNNKTIYDFVNKYDLDGDGFYSGVIWRWVAVGGGILLVAGVITLLIIRRRNAMKIRAVPGGRKGSETKKGNRK